jgi:hypothetical protein
MLTLRHIVINIILLLAYLSLLISRADNDVTYDVLMTGTQFKLKGRGDNLHPRTLFDSPNRKMED